MPHEQEGCEVRTGQTRSAATNEIHLRVPPSDAGGSFDAQAASMYERLRASLREHGIEPRDVVAERIFLSDVGAQVPRLAALRRDLYGDEGAGALHPATTCVQDPPARPGRFCELQAVALRASGGGGLPSRRVDGLPAGASGRVVEDGGLRHIFLAGLNGGAGGHRPDFHAEAAEMFQSAAAALRREGAAFRDVARTWIYIADIDRQYGAFNRARRAFFAGQGIATPPASTAIRGVPFPPERGCALELRAFAGGGRRVVPFRVPAMNEAADYGSDFSRGLRVDLADRALIFISGTASIDAGGAVVHAGDIEGQIERMLRNIEALLGTQGAGYADVLSSVTYLKERAYLEPYLRIAARHGVPETTPSTICLADICRPEWLCEMEVTAARALERR